MKKQFLTYTGSVVLGLSDSVVSVIGALAGFSSSFSDPRAIGFAGAVIGLSGALSMGASEFLSEQEEGKKSPIIAALFTGSAYLFSAVVLVLPYFILSSPLRAFECSLVIALGIICMYAWYVSIHKEGTFLGRAGTMIAVSLVVGLLSYLFAMGLQTLTGIEI